MLGVESCLRAVRELLFVVDCRPKRAKTKHSATTVAAAAVAAVGSTTNWHSMSHQSLGDFAIDSMCVVAGALLAVAVTMPHCWPLGPPVMD